MMGGLLPIVEQLADCGTDWGRAQWLFSCPWSVIGREEGAIRAVLRQGGFLPGIEYLDAQLTAMRAVRGPYGLFTAGTMEMLISAAAALAVAAELSRLAAEEAAE